MEHAKLSPSGAERWVNCPGSVTLCENLTPLPDDEYSAEGTKAHALGAFALQRGETAEEVAKSFEFEIEHGTVDPDMIEAVSWYVDTVKEDFENASMTFVEFRVNASWIAPDCWGTLDAGAYHEDTKTLYVDDYKHGVMEVDVEFNKQLMIYAFGLMSEIFSRLSVEKGKAVSWVTTYIEKIVFRIIQPNDFMSDEKVKTWETDAATVLMWAYNVLIPAVNRTSTHRNFLCPGKHCRYCEGKVICPELKALAQRISHMDCTDVDGNPFQVPTLSPEYLAELIRFQTVFNAWAKDAKEHAQILAREGNPIPGHKLVRPNQKRVFYPGFEDQLISYGVDPFTHKPIGPAEAEKRLKEISGMKEKEAKETIKPLWYNANENAEPVLVPDSDRRPAVEPGNRVQNLFNDDLFS